MIQPFLGLALGGGGARGAAHIGVLQELHQGGVKIDTIAGTSAGSVIGAMYAATRDPFWVENRFRDFIKSKPFSGLRSKRLAKGGDPDSVFDQIAKKVSDQYVMMMSLKRRSIIKKDPLLKAIKFLLPVSTFKELKVPLKVISTDLNSCEDRIDDSGDLIEAVVRSCSIPGFVEPSELNNEIIVDGGVGMPIPVPAIKKECVFTLAIDISRYQLKPMKKVNMMEIIKRADMVTSLRLKARLSEEADFVISPNTMGLHWSDFDQFETLIEKGKDAARISLDQLKTSINQKQTIFSKMKEWLS